ncbi:MAG TPA: hypothetical protein VF519_12575 [Mycobacteriales bacterium]
MRKTLALAALAAAAAGLVPATSASASCVTVYPLPGCYNACTAVAGAYRAADAAAGDALPDLTWNCVL